MEPVTVSCRALVPLPFSPLYTPGAHRREEITIAPIDRGEVIARLPFPSLGGVGLAILLFSILESLMS